MLKWSQANWRHWVTLGGAVAIVLLIACGGFLAYRYSRTWSPMPTAGNSGPHAGLTWEGLVFPGNDEQGRRTYEVRVGTCKVGQKRAGLLRPGYINTAELRGLEIDLYRWPPVGEKTATSIRPTEASALPAALQDFPRLFPSSQPAQFSTQEVTIRLIEAAQTNLIMVAGKLTPRSSRHVLLEGNVSIRADDGRRELQTDRVVWWLETGQLAVPGPYQLRRETELFQHKRTVFDLALQPITDPTKETDHESANTIHTAMHTP